ncbi:hypothetical protein Efla_004010 [Eimeria flavescens]
MQRVSAHRASSDEHAALTSGVTSPSAEILAAAAATTAAAAAAAAPVAAQLKAGSVKPELALQQTGLAESTAHYGADEQQLQRLRNSKPLVLSGRLRYTFATRTAEDTQLPLLRKAFGGGGISSSSSSGCIPRKTGETGFEVLRPDSRPRSAEGRSTTPQANSANGSSGTSTTKGIDSLGNSSACLGSSAHVALPPSEPYNDKGSNDSRRSSSSRNGCNLSRGGDSSRSSDANSSSNNAGSSSSAVGSGSTAKTDKSGSSTQKKQQQLPPIVAPDIAVLLRDFATFVQRVERQLQQLQQLQHQHQAEAVSERTPQQQQQGQQQQHLGCPRAAPWGDRPLASSVQQIHRQQGEHPVLLQHHQEGQQQLQRENPRQLLRSISEGAVVCRSLHARLSSLLSDPAAAAVAPKAGSSALLLAKLRRDFAQQQLQYSRLLRLLDASAEVLREASNATQQQQPSGVSESSSSRRGRSAEAEAAAASAPTAPAGPLSDGDWAPARIVWHSHSSACGNIISGSSPGGFKFDAFHFCYPRPRRQTDSILWAADGERGISQPGCVVGLPRLLIGPSRPSAAGLVGGPLDAPEDVWEPAALLEVDENYEKQQILNERKEQLQQLRQVERCVSVLREMQLHVAEDVSRGEQLLCVVEEDTEAAADHTAAGAGELAAAARSKSRWWGVQGGGAAALLGVSIGAVAGGPIGAAVGAVVGAVAGVSSGAALRVRHRERVSAIEKTVRRRRTQRRLKRSSVAAVDAGSASRLVHRVSSAGALSQAPSAGGAPARDGEPQLVDPASERPLSGAGSFSIRGSLYGSSASASGRAARSDGLMTFATTSRASRGSRVEAGQGAGPQQRDATAAATKAVAAGLQQSLVAPSSRASDFPSVEWYVKDEAASQTSGNLSSRRMAPHLHLSDSRSAHLRERSQLDRYPRLSGCSGCAPVAIKPWTDGQGKTDVSDCAKPYALEFMHSLEGTVVALRQRSTEAESTRELNEPQLPHASLLTS